MLGDPLPTKKFGSKAANFYAFSRLGIPFPSGIVLSHSLVETVHRQPEMWGDLFAFIRKKWGRMFLGRTLAVRSSGLDEDLSEKSLAGEYESCLGISFEREPLFQAISRVRESYENRESRGGVIIQQLVEADLAGVSFSVNPLTYDPFEMVVEWTDGVGEKVLSGEVNAKKEVLSKLLIPEHGWQIRLREYLLQLENYFGHPVDVEFAVEKDTLFLLQCRPVTTPFPLRGPMRILTRENVGEVIPFGLTPLSASFFLRIANRAFHSIAFRLDKRRSRGRLFHEYEQMVYFDHYVFRHTLFRKRRGIGLILFGFRLMKFMAGSFLRAIINGYIRPLPSGKGKYAQWEKEIETIFTIHLSISIVAEILNQVLGKFKGKSGSELPSVRTAYDYLREEWSDDRTERDWIALIMAKYYYFSNDEFELAEPRWGESHKLAGEIVRQLKEMRNQSAGRESLQPAGDSLFSPSTAGEKILRIALGLREQNKKKLLQALFFFRKALLEWQHQHPGVNVFQLEWEHLMKEEGGQRGKPGSLTVFGRKEASHAFPPRLITDGRNYFPPPVQPNKPDKGGASGWSGLPCSPGKWTGKVKRIHNLMELSTLQEKRVILMTACPPGAIPYLHRAGAIVTEVGGILSHASIAAREKGIPFVAGISGITELCQDEDVVEVDGFRGMVSKVEKL